MDYVDNEWNKYNYELNMDLGDIHEEEVPVYELASWDMPGRQVFKQQVRGRRLNNSTRSTKKKKQQRA